MLLGFSIELRRWYLVLRTARGRTVLAMGFGRKPGWLPRSLHR